LITTSGPFAPRHRETAVDAGWMEDVIRFPLEIHNPEIHVNLCKSTEPEQ